MAKQSFADLDAEHKEETAGSPAAGAAEAPKSTAISTQSNTGIGEYTGDSSASEDINIDHIQILGRSSQFDVDGASIGDICINKERVLAGLDSPVKGILVHTRKYWKENVPYGDSTIPRFANTPEEKAEIERTTEFKGTVPVCEVTLLLERPESFTDEEAAASIFLYELGGKEYALVKYTVQKAQAVRENYGTINVAVRARKTRGEDASEFYFELVSKEKGAGTQYKWHQFVLKGSTAKAPEEAVDFARSLRGE